MYTLNETAKIFDVSRTKVIYWINVGIIEGEKKHGKWLINGTSLADWKKYQEAGIPSAIEDMRQKFEIASMEFRVVQNEHYKAGLKK